jgi:hypothetical protein
MKKITFEDLKKTRRWVLPAGVVALGLVSVAATQPPASNSKAVTEVSSTSSQSQDTESPAPTATPDITVNGEKVPVDEDGSTDVNTSGGKTKVEVSGGQTRITTSGNTSDGDTSNSQSGNVNINIDSHSSSGSSWGSTQVYGFSANSGNSGTSYHSTSIFSTDSDHVSVSQQ